MWICEYVRATARGDSFCPVSLELKPRWERYTHTHHWFTGESTHTFRAVNLMGTMCVRRKIWPHTHTRWRAVQMWLLWSCCNLIITLHTLHIITMGEGVCSPYYRSTKCVCKCVYVCVSIKLCTIFVVHLSLYLQALENTTVLQEQHEFHLSENTHTHTNWSLLYPLLLASSTIWSLVGIQVFY